MKKELKNTFRLLLKQKPLNMITVKEIVECAGVNRNSFYYHYKDIQDILEDIIIEDSDKFLQKYSSIETIDDLILAVYVYALERKASILNIYAAFEGKIYEKSALNLCEKLVSIYLNSSKKEISTQDRRIIKKYLSFSLFGTVIAWIMSGMEEKEIDDIKRVGKLMKKGIEIFETDS